VIPQFPFFQRSRINGSLALLWLCQELLNRRIRVGEFLMDSIRGGVWEWTGFSGAIVLGAICLMFDIELAQAQVHKPWTSNIRIVQPCLMNFCSLSSNWLSGITAATMRMEAGPSGSENPWLWNKAGFRQEKRNLHRTHTPALYMKLL
jgi:hypothetical protein